MNSADFLVEIGTEELPPKALRSLMEAFAAELAEAVDEARLGRGDVHAYASPRRLAVLIEALDAAQADRPVSQKGPPVNVAFDENGGPTPAAIAFAKKCGVEVAKLGRSRSDKGEWLAFEHVEKGMQTTELIAGLVEKALAALPVPRRMRWGSGDQEFVRPVHWVVLLHGKTPVRANVMGFAAGNVTRGHRIHSEGPIEIGEPKKYLQALKNEGHVIADFAERRALVADGVAAAAADAGGTIVDGESLYDEVAALVEWPVPMLGDFDPGFLDLPREVVIATLTGHQRYFPVADDNDLLLPKFVTVANLESRDPKQVREGNERVIRPRLADAAFFWASDRRRSLDSRREALNEVVYQRGLGSLHDRSKRIASIAGWIAAELEVDPTDVERAATLCKCDLVTGMVGEFPELQGVMGGHYAAADGEAPAVGQAIGEHYRPRFAGDALPESVDGRILAVADKLDTLAGIFAIGKKPSGNRDPFGLRRAALGVIRILVECGLDTDLRTIIGKAVILQLAEHDVVRPATDAAAKQKAPKRDPEEIAAEVFEFVTDRLRRYFLDREPTLATETFEAVRQVAPESLVDFDARLAAVQDFLELPEAASLAAANKRIANILRQAGDPEHARIEAALLGDSAEQALYDALHKARERHRPLIGKRRYTEALCALAALRAPVDRFFDEVMVMVDEAPLRDNRLALLGELRELFLDVADISRLAIA